MAPAPALAPAQPAAPVAQGAAPAAQIPAPNPAPVPPTPRTDYPYKAQPQLALALFAAGLLTMFGPLALTVIFGVTLPVSGGGIAATAAFLFTIALILQAPALVLDGSPESGGEPSTMRILTLAIVLTFCGLELKSCWDAGKLQALDQTWVWLVVAALGGKAAQAYTELQQGKR